jgi:hypothetical protein
MNNWKTTATGILTIVVALANAGMTFLKTGAVPEIGTLIAAVTAGVGLILAKDAVK